VPPECPRNADAKFGIWAHWSPQCQPEQGDWYAFHMYRQGSRQYQYHVEHYGHPLTFGYKDICNLWKAEKWDPERLIRLYKRAGASCTSTTRCRRSAMRG
jgi:alpha-L-fucosidase